jgi:hypothetical protein
MPDPSTEPTVARAIRLARQGRTDEACAMLRQVLRRDPRQVEALLALGALTSSAEEGIQALEWALKLDPGNELALRALTELRARHEAEAAARGTTEAAAQGEVEATAPPEPVPTPTRPTADQLRVVAGSTYLVDQEAALNRRRTALGTGLLGLLAAAVVVGLAPAVSVVLGIGDISIVWAMVALLLEGVVWLATPAVSQLRDAWKHHRAGREGEERLEAFLRQHLSANWTLFRNVVLPDGRGDIDAVLLGPRGVFALEVKAYTGYYHNVGRTWKRRAYGRWYTLDRSPTRQVLRNTVALSQYLERCGVDVWVEPRVVWAKDSKLWLERPTVRVWQLHDPQFLLEDIEGQRRLAEAVTAGVVRALEAAVAEDENGQA